MRSPTVTRTDRYERDPLAGAAQRAARRGRGRRARGRARRREAATALGLREPRNAWRGAHDRAVRAPAPTRGRRDRDQRAVRRHPRRAARDRTQGGRGRRAEAAMILWWIGDIVLVVVLLPVVVYLLRGVLSAAQSIVPTVQRIAGVAAEGSKDLDATALLRTTQDQVARTVAGVADYGGSLNVILDDA